MTPPIRRNRVKDGPACSGCGLPNYSGLCPVCRGDEDAARREGMPFPWPDPEVDESCSVSSLEAARRRREA